MLTGAFRSPPLNIPFLFKKVLSEIYFHTFPNNLLSKYLSTKRRRKLV